MLLLIKGYPWVAHFHKMNFDNFLLNVCLTLAFDLKGKMEVGPKDKWKRYWQFGAANSLTWERLCVSTAGLHLVCLNSRTWERLCFHGRPSPGMFNLACSPVLVVSLEGLLYFLWMMDVSKKRPLCPIPNLISQRSRQLILLSGDPLYFHKNT